MNLLNSNNIIMEVQSKSNKFNFNINELLNFYNSESNNNISNLELEITYHSTNNIQNRINLYKLIFTKLYELNKNINISEFINIYYENNINKNSIRLTKQFKHGINLNKDILISKKLLFKPIKSNFNTNNLITYYNIKLNKEEELDLNLINNFKKIIFINIKFRISFIFEKYKIELDLIKIIDQNKHNIKNIKNKIFKKYNLNNLLEEIDFTIFDEFNIETEFINTSSNLITNNDLDKNIEFIYSLINEQSDNIYQKYIYNIAKFIINNNTYLENFKYKFGIKKLLNNVVELNPEIYYKNIMPQINNYYITDKIDGFRCIIYIVQNNDLLNIKLVTDKLISIKECNDDIDINNSSNLVTILDSECIFNNIKKSDENLIISYNDINLYIFDIISYENEKVAYMPFEKRFEFLQKGFKKIDFFPSSKIKEFITVDKNSLNKIKEFYTKKYNNKNYYIDGLIFVPTSNVLSTDNKKEYFKINTNYNNMIGYKWKPLEDLSIDFYICKLPKNLYNNIPYNSINLKKDEIIYILFLGINKNDFDKLNISYMIDYKKIVPEQFINKLYFPIQFSPSSKPNNYIFISNNDNLHNQIGEFTYANNKWNLKKLREDRLVELNRGNYFGNYFKIGELIWNNMNNPLTLEMLISENKSYFLNDNNEFYKALRSFNSFVKTRLLEIILSSSLSDKNDNNWIIDLASGKGQDLPRINNLGFKNGLFIDNDSNALSELINRKYNLKTTNKEHNIKIYTKNIDLTTNYKLIIKEITTDLLDIKKESIDVIICNFAIHYILSNQENLFNLIKLLDYYLKPNGRFIFTCFNGYKINKLLEKTTTWNLYENNNLKYSIKKLYKHNNLIDIGQKIDVLLPFSNTQYYSEYLINLDYILDTFDENNFISEISLPFSTFFNEFKSKNVKINSLLTNIDKEYIDLYQFNIIKKNINNNITLKSNILSFFNSQEKIIIKSYYKGSNNSNINTKLKKKYNIDKLLFKLPKYIINKIQYDDQALYSITDMNSAEIISKIILNLPNINNNSSIIDATASVGGNVFLFSKYFNHVTAIEIDQNRFNMLNNNIKLLQDNNLCNNNIETINDDFITYLNNNNINSDIIFFDPPWGGVNYKKYNNISLYLSDINMSIIIKKLIEKNKNNKLKYIIMKVPNNINIDDYDEFSNIMTINNDIHKFTLLIFNLIDNNVINNELINQNQILSLENIKNGINSNKILLILNLPSNMKENNSCSELYSNIINILNIFYDYNYKNNNYNKKNKNKIIKVIINFNKQLEYKIANYYIKLNNFSSIIFYDYTFHIDENINYSLIKVPITPLILNDKNTNNIIILDEYILKNIIQNKYNIFDHIKLHNLKIAANNNKFNYLYNTNYIFDQNDLNITVCKYFDLIK